MSSALKEKFLREHIDYWHYLQCQNHSETNQIIAGHCQYGTSRKRQSWFLKRTYKGENNNHQGQPKFTVSRGLIEEVTRRLGSVVHAHEMQTGHPSFPTIRLRPKRVPLLPLPVASLKMHRLVYRDSTLSIHSVSDVG